MAYILCVTICLLTYGLFVLMNFKKVIGTLLHQTKNSFLIIKSNVSDEVKQKQLLQNSAKQFGQSVKLIIFTLLICLPGALYYWFYQQRFNETSFLINTSLLSLFSFLVGFFFPSREK